MSKFRRLFILCIFLLLFGIQLFNMFASLPPQENGSGTVSSISQAFPSSNIKIVIGAVICTSYGDTGPREKAVVMMKSVIMSAMLYNVSKIEFHLFLERRSEADFYSGVFKEWENLPGDLQMRVYIHGVVHAVPEKYQKTLLYDERFRCGYVRMFFPTVLSHVDSILYLDLDTIVTGSIADLWSHFGKMTDGQLIGVIRNKEPNNIFWRRTFSRWFSDIPYPPPKGLNSGVLLMNLTRMRGYRWEEKFLRLWDDYSKLYTLNDQRALNILLYFNEGLLQIVPCHFNFRFTHCEKGLFCDDVEEDSKGVQLVHGAASYFEEGRPFHKIYVLYKEFNITHGMNNKSLMENLMVPLREAFKLDSPLNVDIGVFNKTRFSKCFGIIDKLLFKNYFVQNVIAE